MSTVEQIKAAYEAFVEENEKFVEKGNKAAGGRARKALMELAKLAKVRRAEILEEKKQFFKKNDKTGELIIRFYFVYTRRVKILQLSIQA